MYNWIVIYILYRYLDSIGYRIKMLYLNHKSFISYSTNYLDYRYIVNSYQSAS